MLITLSGLDGAGKSTLIQGLRAALEERGVPVAVLHLDHDVGVYAALRKVRDGGVSAAVAQPADTNPSLARRIRNAVVWSKVLRRLIYPIDVIVLLCYRAYIEGIQRRILVMDRYHYDTLVDVWSESRWGRLWTRLLRFFTPTPALPILVETRPEVAFARKQEYSLPYLRDRWNTYIRVFGRVPNAVKLRNDDPGSARDDLRRIAMERTGAAQPDRAGAPIRVLMITSEWPVPDGRPRTTFFIKRQVEFLQAAGVHVDVFHFKGAGKAWNYVKAWLEAKRRVRRGNYDLVHAQFGQSGVLALPKRLPLVVTFRGDDLQGIEDASGRLTIGGRLLKLASQFVARRADATLVVSEHMTRFVPPPVRAHVIPSGLDLSLFRLIPQDEARRHLALPADKRLVLFAGDPALPRKRYWLAKAALDLVDPSLGAELVVAWGAPHSDIPFYMNACDALVFTSMQEGSPNVVKEALACDLPVVSVAVGDVPLRLQRIAGCELCADDQPATIARALERVLRQRRRVAGREAVQELDERRLTQDVIAIYRSVLTRQQPWTQAMHATDAIS
ncbi:MAG TPA: glycosyltransferase [Gemmatimonadales bacterium]|nr:glycosyltransferase [Gemmatimonadales bacterium]